MSFVTHLEAAIDGTRLPADRVWTLHNDRPIWVRYDLNAVRRAVGPGALADRPANMWRYGELLPLPSSGVCVSLGEQMTSLRPAAGLGKHLGLADLWIKDESSLPTGSFKSRGMAVAVSMARHFGISRVAAPTAGNAGAALAAYGARAGMRVDIFMPEDTPRPLQLLCETYGAIVHLVDGVISDCGRLVREGVATHGWFDMATLKEPYRIEGKKTMGLELADQFEWRLPDVILYPTGGGTGLIGMAKAFDELRELGWLRSETMPRFIAVQSDGCAPIVRALQAGERFAAAWAQPKTTAWGIRVPAAIGDFMILDAIRQSGGTAVAVPEGDIEPMRRWATERCRLPLCPEAAACLVAAQRLTADGLLRSDEKVVLFNTCAASNYVEQ